MPSPLMGALTDYVAAQLEIEVWLGEIPKTAPDGQFITPSSPPSKWPACKVTMPESGLDFEETFENAYGDKGPIVVSIWGNTLTETQELWMSCFELLANSSNWNDIFTVGSGWKVYSLELRNSYIGQEEGVRIQGSKFLFRGELRYDVGVHGSVQTRGA